MNEARIFPCVETQKCFKCGEEFKSFIKLLRHKMTHMRKLKVLRCVLCNKKFSKIWKLKQHYVLHRGQKAYECDNCKKCFYNKSMLIQHTKLHEIKVPFKEQYVCLKCGIYFKKRSALARHKRTHLLKEKGVNCDICLKSFFDISSLKQHYIIHTEKKQFQSDNCDKQLINDSHPVRYNKISETTTVSPKRVWKCSECDKVFQSHTGLRLHIKKHFGVVKVHTCEVCGKKFAEKSILKQHYIVHTGEKPFQCETCKKCFNKKSTLTKHYKIHLREIPSAVSLKTSVQLRTCSECEKQFKSRSGLRNHKKIAHGIRKFYPCHICNKKYATVTNLKQHFLTHTREKPFVCEVCRKGFNDRSNLVRHLKIHYSGLLGPKPTQKCNDCGKEFKSVIALWNHRTGHFRNMKVYKCGLCDLEFSEISLLKQHFKTHSDKKPFECDICDLWYVKKIRLLIHKRLHLPEFSPNHLLKCSECGKEFKKGGLLTHMRAHSGEHACDVCGRTFSEYWKLKKHYIIHTGERPFKCDTCGKCFKKKGELVNHTNFNHSSSFVNKCSDCGKEFKSYSGFQKHKLNYIIDNSKVHKCDLCGKKFSDIARLERHHKFHIGKEPLKNKNNESIKKIKETEIISPVGNVEEHTKELLDCDNTEDFASDKPRFINLIKLSGISTLKQLYYTFHVWKQNPNTL